MTDPPRLSRRALLRAVTLTVLLVVVVLVAVVGGAPQRGQIEGWLTAAGPVAPLVFLLVYALSTLFPVPKNVLSILAGLLFGMGWGLVLVWAAAVLGAVTAYQLGRSLGREAVEALTGARLAKLDDVLARHGLLSIIAVRLVPVLPFTAINYAAGLTAVTFPAYLLGTALGIIPGTIAYVALGAYATELSSWPFVAAAVTLLLLSVGGVIAARRWRARPGKTAPGSGSW